MKHAIFTAEFLEMRPELEQCLLEIVGTRHAGNGVYHLHVAPMTRDGVDMTDSRWVFADDVEPAEF